MIYLFNRVKEKMIFLQRSYSKGFTLIEMLVVLVLISMLAGLVGPKLFHKVSSSKIKIAKTQLELITSGLDTYRLDVGRFPSTEQGLAALLKTPEGVRNWDGPYLSKELPPDPWGGAYHYKRPGTEKPYALFTLGQDAEIGGEGEDQDLGRF